MIDQRKTPAMRSGYPMKFFLLVFALSVPFWLIGAASTLKVMPGLPVSSLMVLCPPMAASILLYRRGRLSSVTGMLKRSFDFRRVRSKVWYLPAVLLMPAIAVLAYALMRLLHRPLPVAMVPGMAVPLMFLMFFVAALAEELGWSGFALDPLQDRGNALQAGILVGLVWAAWHIVPFLQAERSPAWIAWQMFTLVASRILIVWLYNNTQKSVFVAALSHAMINVSWQLFPNHGSDYDPRITGLITALAVVLVTVVWGPRTLVRCS